MSLPLSRAVLGGGCFFRSDACAPRLPTVVAARAELHLARRGITHFNDDMEAFKSLEVRVINQYLPGMYVTLYWVCRLLECGRYQQSSTIRAY